jgi:hypothetical protein
MKSDMEPTHSLSLFVSGRIYYSSVSSTRELVSSEEYA